MRTPANGWFDLVGILMRWAVGALFIYMGLSKAMDPIAFLKLAREYNLVNNPVLLNVVAATLPWFEVVCGALLVAGIAVRGTALMLILMLIPFTAMVLQRGLGIADARHVPFCSVKFDCGCGAGEVFICAKLLENVLLTAASVFLLFGWGRRWSAWYAPLTRTANSPAQAQSHVAA